MKNILPVFLLTVLFLSGIGSAWGITISVRVSSSNDDGEEQNPANNTMSRSSTDLEFSYDGGTRQHVGMRFQALSIPQGATINSAYIEFEVDETDSGTTNVVIMGQDSDDARTFGNGANNLSNRTRTTASVNWSIPAWNTTSSKQQTPDIGSIVQEVINRSGWVSGNDLAVIVEPGSGCNSSSCQRTAESEDGEAANAPLLVIDYTVGGALTCDTFRDEFSDRSYNNQHGTANWSSDWTEIGDNGNVNNGDVNITGNRLHLQDDNNGVLRSADLSAYATATITFDYQESSLDSSSEYAELQIRTGGSGSWAALQRFAGSTDNTGSTTISIDLYIDANTEVRFITPSGSMDNNDDFYIDNFQIEACNSPKPTVDSLTTSDNTPVVTGTFDSGNAAGEFTVQVNAINYTLGSSAELTSSGDDWTLDLSSAIPLAIGLYDVVATVDDGAGTTTSDTTYDELSIIAQVCSATFSDNFSSTSFGNNDGDTNFTGDWDEFEGTSLTVPESSPNASSGYVRISGGQLILNNYSPESANAPGVERELDLSTFTSATFTFDFVTSGDVDNDDSILIQASSNGGTSWTLLENIRGIGNTTGSRSYDLTPYISTNTKIRLRFNTAINSGSCCYGAASETISFDNIDIQASGSCSSVDHYSVSHNMTGVTCEATLVTISAHNADHSLFNVTSDTAVTITANPVVDAITSSPVTILSGQSSATITMTETSVTTAPHIDINVTDGSATETSGSAIVSEDPALAFVDSLLQFVTDTNTPPTTTIATQIGGKPSSTAPNSQNIYLRAVRTDNTSGSPVCVAALDAGTHDIDMGYQCLDTGNCSANEVNISNSLTFNSGASTTIAHNDGATTGNTLPVTLSFDSSGYAPLSFLYSNVGNIALFTGDYITASGSTIGSGISDQFIVRPFATVLDFDNGSGTFNMRELDWSDGTLNGSSGNNSYSDPASNPQNSTIFQTAGSSFPAEITGVLWQAIDDGDSNGEPDVGANLFNNSVATLFGQESTSVVQITHTLEEPAGANAGMLTSSFSNAYNNGKIEGSMNWNEVGIIDIQLTLASFLGETSYSPVYTAEDVGRFIPASFDVSSVIDGGFQDSCGSFTYIGQDFDFLAAPSFIVTAKNALSSPDDTTNYAGNWSKLSITSFSLSIETADATNSLDVVHTPASPRVSLVDNSNGSSTITFGSDTFCYGVDSGSGCLKQDNSIIAEFSSDISITLSVITDSDSVSSTVNQSFNPASNTMRYGRLRVDNVYGSELEALVMPAKVEYFNGSTFLLNTDDNCTIINDADLPGTIPLGGGSSTVTVIPPTAGSGVRNFSLTAPGAGNTGDILISVDLNASLDAWLQYNWDGIAGDEDPTGRATFGIYNGDSRQIYYRQIYQ